jgi:ATP-dependent DNA ligase
VSLIVRDAPPEGIVKFLLDLLHIDGDDLLDTPLEERATRLEATVLQIKIPAVVTSGADRPNTSWTRRYLQDTSSSS